MLANALPEVKCETSAATGDMSKDLPEGHVFKEEQNLFRYCNGNLNFSTVSHDDDDYGYHKKKMMRDPMSHRIIEKRRRDRMNNCLADLSRLIPPDYLKKGRGRIEKTEIIEMAIKHMRHLQSIISASGSGETRGDDSAASPPVAAAREGGVSSSASHQPIVAEHYRLGYLECLSEAMHFLVEVQGYFAGDSLCVQMIDHLHKHCDKILKNDSLNYPRKHTGETTSSNSSASPTNGNYSNNSPPLGLSISNGSNSDDNQTSAPYDNGRSFEPIEDPLRSIRAGFRSPGRYSDLSCGAQSRDAKKNREILYPRYSEPESERIAENPSDSDLEQGYAGTARSKDGRNCARERCDEFSKGLGYIPRNYSSSSGIASNAEYPLGYEDFFVKEENGSSQLRDMLSSPRMLPCNYSDGANPCSKRSASPERAQAPVGDAPPSRHFLGLRQPGSPDEESPHRPEAPNRKARNAAVETEDATSREAVADNVASADAHGNLYKFKNNISQRFSKERRGCENEGDAFGKKVKTNEEPRMNATYRQHSESDPVGRKYADPLAKERLHLLGTSECDEYEKRKRGRLMCESESRARSDLEMVSNRLSFGHKAGSRLKKWDERSKNLRAKHSPPYLNAEVPMEYKAPEAGGPGRKAAGLLAVAERLPSEVARARASFDGAEGERDVGIPIFALHAEGSFYVPLTLDRSSLEPFLSLLGAAKSEEADEKAVLHPVTISVNFRMPYLTKWHGKPFKYSS